MAEVLCAVAGAPRRTPRHAQRPSRTPILSEDVGRLHPRHLIGDQVVGLCMEAAAGKYLFPCVARAVAELQERLAAARAPSHLRRRQQGRCCGGVQACEVEVEVSYAPLYGRSSHRSGPVLCGSQFGRNELEFQTHRNISDAAEEEMFLDGCQASIAVVIAYPTHPIKAEMDEFALGTAHTLCSGPWTGQDTPWISHT